MTDPQEQLKNYLKQQNHSVTICRLEVFKAMLSREPQTMAEIIKLTNKIDRASVYRTISLFENLNIVRRLNIGWKYKLELSDMFNNHHHHLSCLKCGLVLPIEENEKLEAYIKELAKNQNFKSQDHELEIRGLCYKCS